MTEKCLERKKSSPLRVYVFIRTDIPLADQLVQVSHSCLLAGAAYKPNDKTYVVMCQVRNEQELIDMSILLEEFGVRYEIFHEPKNAGGKCLGWTSIATEPIEMIEHSKIKLWTHFSFSDIVNKLL